MAQSPAPGIIQVEMIYALENENAENVYHVNLGGQIDAPTLGALIDHFVAWENATMKGTRHSLAALVRVIARDLSAPDGLVVTKSVTPFILGGAGGIPLPNHVTLAVKANTGLGGRSNRGRVFHIGLSSAMVTGSTINPPWDSNIVNAYNALIPALNAFNAAAPAVLSRFHNKVQRNPATFNLISNYSLTDLTVDSMRRRLPNHNRHR